MSGGHSEVVPRLPIPNRTVKRLSADDSAGSRVKVGHRQTPLRQSPAQTSWALCIGAAKTAISYQPTLLSSPCGQPRPPYPADPLEPNTCRPRPLTAQPQPHRHPPHAGLRPAPGCACGLCRATLIGIAAALPCDKRWPKSASPRC